MIIGITGKSGSGKSTTSKYIRELGYVVLDVDKLHKEVSALYMNEIYKVYESLGYEQLTHKEKVDLFFSDESIRGLVNDITFDKTVVKVKNELQQLNNNSIIFLDAPLLFDMGLDTMCDKIWYVYCPMNTNIQRLMNRNNLSYQEALIRYNAIHFDCFKEFDLKINTETNNQSFIRERINDYEKSYLCRKF